MSREYDCFITLKKWMENRNQGKSFVTYFESYHLDKIAIYGAGDVGMLLYEELKSSDIEIVCFVDQNAEGIDHIDQIPVITANQIPEYKDLDAVVVSPIGNYLEICEMLTEICPELPTISLKDAVYEV